MKLNEHDILSSDYICTIGKRLSAYTDKWEVYATLANRGEFIFGTDASESDAVRLVIEARKAAEAQGQQFYLTERGQHVNLYNIVRIFLDTHATDHAVVIEDAAGMQWLVYVGDRDSCLVILHDLEEKAMSDTGEFDHD